MAELLDGVVQLVEAAGRRVMEVYSGSFESTLKADNSPLTEADLASHKILCDGLAALDPSIPILSEEAAEIPNEKRREWDRFWLVDPLDGTKEFIGRTGEFTVNVALVEDGKPILGVVGAPALGRVYVGSPEGAFRDERPVYAGTYSGGVLRVVASRSHAGAETEEWLGKLEAIYPEIELVSCGSSLKLCMIADGQAHLYPRLGPTMEWDIAAAYAVVVAAGGSVTDFEGRPLEFNKPDLHNPWFLVSAPGVDGVPF